MNKIEKLKALSNAGTERPWYWEHNGGYCEGPSQSEEEFYGPIIGGTHDKKRKENTELIAEMRNNFDALLEIAEAAKELNNADSAVTTLSAMAKIAATLKAFEEI